MAMEAAMAAGRIEATGTKDRRERTNRHVEGMGPMYLEDTEFTLWFVGTHDDVPLNGQQMINK
jgi:hypothetical protein